MVPPGFSVQREVHQPVQYWPGSMEAWRDHASWPVWSTGGNDSSGRGIWQPSPRGRGAARDTDRAFWGAIRCKPWLQTCCAANRSPLAKSNWKGVSRAEHLVGQSPPHRALSPARRHGRPCHTAVALVVGGGTGRAATALLRRSGRVSRYPPPPSWAWCPGPPLQPPLPCPSPACFPAPASLPLP